MNKMCAYCGKYFNGGDLTPLYEKGKPHILYYCPKCFPEVKSNLADYARTLGQVGIPSFYRFGERGENP